MIRKAVIPVAGLGTRLLPLTKAAPKEMLPVGDKPVIEHTIRELADSGIVEITIVTSTRKAAIQTHFAPDRELEYQLEQAGKPELARSIRELSSLAHITYLYQEGPYGNGTRSSMRLASWGRSTSWCFGPTTCSSPTCRVHTSSRRVTRRCSHRYWR